MTPVYPRFTCHSHASIPWHNIFDITHKPESNNTYMPNEKTDNRGAATRNPDQERDLAGKEGPVTKSDNPDNEHSVPSPYSSDLQTQIAAKSDKDRNKDNTGKDIKQ